MLQKATPTTMKTKFINDTTMKIEIKSMTLQNFKKVRSQEIAFSHNVLISGANKAGKTTIYDAYLWCIFGVLSKQNGIVQPLNTDNNIIHKLETSVTVVLDINGEREIKIQRILSEKWKAKDTAEEQFCGTTQERLINDVPLSIGAFKQKLSELVDYEKWYMLSNINLFWTKKVDERRKILMSLAGEINEEELMSPYPAVYKGIVEDMKDLNEMLAQQKSTKKKADDELKLIPAKVQAQNALKADVDFAALKTEKEKLDSQIMAIDAALQGSVHEAPSKKEYIAKVQALNLEIVKAQNSWQNEKLAHIDTLSQKISAASEALRQAKNEAKENNDTYFRNKVELSDISIAFDNKVKEWKEVNDKEFDFTHTDICPVCGRPFTEEMKAVEYDNAVAEFNKVKSEKLIKLQNEASEMKQQIAVLRGNINTYEQITKIHDDDTIHLRQTEYDSLVNELAIIQSRTWDTSSEKLGYENKLAALEASKPHEQPVNISTVENKKIKTELSAKRDELLKILAAEQVNAKIEEEKLKLDNRAKELAQIIADCGDIIRQIKAYKKAKIMLIESKVNSFFNLIRWKFYEQNITNDDEKEICTAIDKDGVDYENTNDGTVINMGVDIIGGISKATDIYVPLFVDRKESAEYIVPVEQQTIFLQCAYGQPLNIESL